MILSLSAFIVGGFPGFYSTWLPEQCWDEAGKTIFCSESWGSHLVSWLTHPATGRPVARCCFLYIIIEGGGGGCGEWGGEECE